MRICPECGFDTHKALHTCPQCSLLDGLTVALIAQRVVKREASAWDRMTPAQHGIEHMMRTNGATR